MWDSPTEIHVPCNDIHFIEMVIHTSVLSQINNVVSKINDVVFRLTTCTANQARATMGRRATWVCRPESISFKGSFSSICVRVGVVESYEITL